MNYTLQAKAAPFEDAAPDDAAAAAETDPQGEVKHEWAGDLYTGTDVTDPVNAYEVLEGADGTVAWLDKADDRTLTGWVRDTDGSVYRYSDADAWAIDVDHADMQVVDDPANLAGDTPPDGAPADGEPVDAAGDAPAGAPVDGEPTDPPADGAPPFGEQQPTDTPPVEEPVPTAPAAPDDAAAPPFEADPADPAADPAADDEDLDAMLDNLEKKSWRSATGALMTVRRVR